MRTINHESDFKIREQREDGTPIWNAPFRFTYYVKMSRGTFVASYDGREFINCHKGTGEDEGKLIVAFDSPQFGTGVLRVKREFFLNDTDFADGVRHYVSDESTDVILDRGATNEGIVVDAVFNPSYYKGDRGLSAYEVWLSEGNKGSVEDYFSYIKGDKGDTGVGIKEVKQTVSSAEDEGRNTIRVTMTNGDYYEFYIRNGSKGEKGDKGSTFTYDDLTQAQKEDLARQVIGDAEDERRAAEQVRQQNETKRESQEAKRTETFNANQAKREQTFASSQSQMAKDFQSAEASRSNTFSANEVSRQSTADASEFSRKQTFNTNEQQRQNTFSTNEAARQSQEAERVVAEGARESAEALRKQAEQVREATFATNENTRQRTFESNEALREENEAKRVDAEISREERTAEAIASIANKVDRDDNAPKLTAGFANNLIGRGEATPQEISFRPSGGDTSIEDGTARIDKVKGNTVVWNQILSVSGLSSQYEPTLYEHILSNGLITIHKSEGGKNDYDAIFVMCKNTFIAARKYLIIFNLKRSDGQNSDHKIDGNGFYDGSKYHDLIRVYGKDYKFFSPTENFTCDRFQITQTVTVGVALSYTLRPVIYDLTQMFGAGNEPTTIEEFNARKPIGIDEYAYNEGELISNNVDEIKSVGFNAWDEEWEVGMISAQDGSDQGGSNQIRSKGYIRIAPSTTYEILCKSKKTQGFIVAGYDEDFRYTGWLRYGGNLGAFTTRENDRYIRFCTYAISYGSVYNHDICIHLVHTGYRNGEYEPYKEFRRSIPVKDIKDKEGNQLFPNGLLSAGSVYDEVTATKAIKRIGVVDMGTLSWGKYQTHYFSISSSEVDRINMARNPNTPAPSNMLCAMYQPGPTYDLSGTDKGMRGPYHTTVYGGQFHIKDTSYTDSATFKAAMSGVMLYYELAEPIEVDLEEPLNLDYEVSDFGTEEVISDVPTTPMKADIIYQFNAVDRIRDNSRHTAEAAGLLNAKADKTTVEAAINELTNAIPEVVNDLTTGGADKALSAEMGKEILHNKYPMFTLEFDKISQVWFDNGYLDSFIDVKLGFDYDESKYFVYFGGLINKENHSLNPNGYISLYKDGTHLYPLIPVESSPNEARIFKSSTGYDIIILDVTKLDPTYDFSISVNSGVNLNPKCFGFRDTESIAQIENNIEEIHRSISESQANESVLFPYVIPSPLYAGETASIQKYGLLSRQFIKELYIYDVSKIQNEDITSVYVSLVARNNSSYGWLIWFTGTDKKGTSSQSFIQAKTGGKNFNESTEIIELVHNNANGDSPCGYIVVDWSFIEDGVNLNSKFKWSLTEHCLDIVYSPIIKSYIEDIKIKDEIVGDIVSINSTINNIKTNIDYVEEVLEQESVITQYVTSQGKFTDGAGGYGSFVYDIEGITGKLIIKSGVSNNKYVAVCRIEDINGNSLSFKYPPQTTDISETQVIYISENDKAKTLYVSVTMSNNVTTKPSSVVVTNSSILDTQTQLKKAEEEIKNVSDKITIFDKVKITDNDKVIDSSIVNPLKCFSDKKNNFGTNNAYNYWYTLFKLPAHTRCVPFERKNTMATSVALVVKIDSLDQFKLNGSYTRLVAGGDVDTSSYGTDEVYQHKPIEFDEDTYIAVLSNSETDYTRFCYLEFWTATDTTLADINDRVLELEGAGKPKLYEIVTPDTIYAVVGDTLQIFYDSIFNVQNLANYQIQVLSDKGKAYPRYFEYTPSASDQGETTLTFNLCEVTDCTTGVTKILTSKEVKLITVPTITNNVQANILCVGDSTTSGGAWCKELARRFYSTDGTPIGIGATNINICGRKTATVSNKLCGWEGTGGWTWGTYISSPTDAIRFQVKDVASLTMGANYVGSNGAFYEIVEINVTNGVGNVRCMYTYDTPNKNDLPTTGTLSKRCPTTAGDDSIAYTSFEKEKFSPFYANGEVDFIDYADRYCNGKIDVMVIHLGINSMFGLKTNLASHLSSIINTAKIFIDKFHEQFPNSKVLLITPPKCSVIGGMAANYNATQTTTEGIYNRQMFQYHKKYFELANQPEYKNWVTVVNTCGEFDTPYGYPYNEKGVDTRVSNIKERIGTNGVHPSGDGYNMIADSVYRTLTGVLNG